MSVKVPYGSVEYQSHHHCQCDFCDSRRKVGAKKFALSSAIAKQKAQQNQHNCCCPGHDASAKQPLSGNGAPSFELDDPEHHVNQTELNAKMGRTGLPDGNQYTTAVGGTRGLRGAGESGTAKAKTREELEEEKMEELDRLERLLILEHKARAKATADAEILSLRQSTGRGPCPKPLEAVPPLPVEDGMDQTMQGTGAYQAGTARETHENAHESFVASPPHGETSQLPQQTVRDGHELARESMNQQQNNAAFGRSSQIGGVGGTTTRQVNSLQADASAAKGAGNSTVKRPWDYFGPRPEGAGVVWRKIQPSIPEDTTTGVGGLGNVDNRHLWKKTLLKGSSAKENTANANSKKTAVAAPDPSIMSPGALAALSLQKQQENDHQARDAVGSPVPTVCNADDTPI
ncbi:hypothetical protein C3747_18g80 [Trypanosoma cruzi]|uniref:Uncharacterized protein n=2 Tax=Trypanosoma cruzi TaxID=5693 RepID=Q4DHA2_TRYCC|nr:hypothetical protein, conserved [Trypanosoma cruzi]EAN91901.1 hypothetical protein, conserved [Trypanosoma cruzi]PWV17462.1 hypothetical protein C3747_18g80 [Trypanosoma cruzi]|eukprot:XP_813752.1 hypothetical protein [Trypanosoma cruzi strain CL Brener]